MFVCVLNDRNYFICVSMFVDKFGDLSLCVRLLTRMIIYVVKGIIIFFYSYGE